jgi:hypothetical protein
MATHSRNVGTNHDPSFEFEFTSIKTIAVTVTKTNLDGLAGDVRITMATNFDTLEKTNKVIRLTAAPIRSTIFQLIGFAIVGGAEMGGHDINIISIMIT